MTRNVLTVTVACMNKFETNNFECFEMIFFKPNNMPLSFASQNFILKCLSTFELAQTNITKESGLKLEAQGPCTGHRSTIAILYCFSFKYMKRE